jgi:hypothetical protein
VVDPDGDSAPAADAADNTSLEVTTMKATHKLDPFEGKVRFALGVALLLIAWDYGWTVIGTGAFVLAVVSLVSAVGGVTLISRLHNTSGTESL